MKLLSKIILFLCTFISLTAYSQTKSIIGIGGNLSTGNTEILGLNIKSSIGSLDTAKHQWGISPNLVYTLIKDNNGEYVTKQRESYLTGNYSYKLQNIKILGFGELENSFTASWALYVRIFSFHGNAIALLTLINGLVLVYSVTRLGYAIFSARTAAISTFLLTLTPVVSGMGITLWHDILMSAGILLVTSFFINVHKGAGSYKRLLILELFPGAVLSSFRPNGLPTIAVFAALYALVVFLKHRSQFVQTVKLLATAFLLSASITVIGSNLILGLSPINNYYAQEWMRNDISCYADSASGNGFVEENIPGIGTTESWRSSAACTFLNGADISSDEKVAAQKYVPSAWLTLLKENPYFILSTHLERNAYLIPIPIFG